MTRVAILGGSFNPPTTGHIRLAEFVLDSGVVDTVWLMPCYGHMHGKDNVTPEHRLEMCKMATTFNKNIRVSDFEIKNKLRGSTFELIERLKKENLCIDFSYIIGLDNANTLYTWHNHEELKKTTKFIVVNRAGVEKKESSNWCKESPHTFLDSEQLIPECSSTLVRNSLKENPTRLTPMLDFYIQLYINKYGLYPAWD